MSEYVDLNKPNVFHSALEPVAERLLNRHLSAAREWFPHEMIPYDQGKTFGKGYEWSPDESMITDPAVSSALFVNLLTEDNLPYYFREIDSMFGADGAFGTWTGEWTTEEGRHSLVIRDYLHATRAIDPRALERGRMAQVRGGEVPHPHSPLEGIFYVALQELATRIAHRNTGARMPDAAGKDIMDRVSRDENLHYVFYKDLGKAALELNPSASVIALERVVSNFSMPGTGITNFDKHSERIALSGIYGAPEFRYEVLHPALNEQWKIDSLKGLSPAAEEARRALKVSVRKIGMLAAQQNGERKKYASDQTS